MAYVLPNLKTSRPSTNSRYVHRQARITVAADGSGSQQISIPGPGRLIGVKYAALTGGALVVKADSTAGVQIWTDGDISTTFADAVPTPVGTTSVDEATGVTAATDGFSGGFPVRTGVFVSVTGGTDTEVLVLDLYFRLCSYVVVDLVAQSGADGSGVATKTVRLNRAGVLTAVAIDYQNTPATADLVIKADNTSGHVLFTRTSSQTDLAPSLVGRPAIDEAGAAGAATDGTEACNFFTQGLFFDLAQSDAFTSGNEKIVVECWIDD